MKFPLLLLPLLLIGVAKSGEVLNDKNIDMIADHNLQLNSYDVQILISLSNQITASPFSEAELFCHQAKKLAELLPGRIKNSLKSFIDSGSPTGFFIISNITYALQELPNTPSSNKYFVGENTQLGKIQAIFNEAYGNMIAYEAEGYGHLHQDMVPDVTQAKSQTSLGSSVELEIHTEQAFSKLRPDLLSLACLRGDKNANTFVLPVNYILNEMTLEEQARLREPLWMMGVDMSFKMNGHEFVEGDIRGPFPIISGPLNDPILVFDQDLIFGIHDEADELINKIVEIYYKHRLSHVMAPGEILLVDNKRAVHGRSKFTPTYDGSDRFIIRTFVVFDYQKSEHARPNKDRMVSARYS